MRWLRLITRPRETETLRETREAKSDFLQINDSNFDIEILISNEPLRHDA